MDGLETPEFEIDKDHDYIMPEGVNRTWITIGNISVHLVRTDEGVVCDMYPLGREMNHPITSTYAFFTEGE
jgi:hypothetical protein